MACSWNEAYGQDEMTVAIRIRMVSIVVVEFHLTAYAKLANVQEQAQELGQVQARPDQNDLLLSLPNVVESWIPQLPPSSEIISRSRMLVGRGFFMKDEMSNNDPILVSCLLFQFKETHSLASSVCSC